MISFMTTEYSRNDADGTSHDVLGIFQDNKLIRTKEVNSARDFLLFIETKNPKTVKGSLRMISKFNKTEQSRTKTS